MKNIVLLSVYTVEGFKICSFASSPILIAWQPDRNMNDFIGQKQFNLIVAAMRTSVLGAI
jgi:hypothetical protein